MMVKGDKVSFDHHLQVTRNIRLIKALISSYSMMSTPSKKRRKRNRQTDVI